MWMNFGCDKCRCVCLDLNLRGLSHSGNAMWKGSVAGSESKLDVVETVTMLMGSRRCARYQGCALGLDVSISTSRSRDVPTSRLGLVSRKIVNVSVSGGRRFGLVSVIYFWCPCKTNFRSNCAGHSTQYERALKFEGSY